MFYYFEEGLDTILDRAEALGMPVRDRIADGSLVVTDIGPSEPIFNEFTHRIRTEVEQNGAEVVMLDGVSGYERASQAQRPHRCWCTSTDTCAI